jgi:hypothetical protein
MSISFSLPGFIEESLRAQVGDLDQAAKEAALIELYRQENLSHYQLSIALGLDRFATNAVLQRHGVTEDLLTVEEFDRQQTEFRKLMGE